MHSPTPEEVIEEDPGYIERILKSAFGDESLKVTSMDFGFASSVGDNYSSILKRVTVKGNSERQKFDFSRSYILKRQIASLSRRSLFRCDIAFQNEMAAYSTILPAFNQFTKLELAVPGSHFSGFDNNGMELIMLEDLTEKGYTMADRFSPLGHSQVSMVMKELGRFHAVSLMMRLLDPKGFYRIQKTITEFVYDPKGEEFFYDVIESSMRNALPSLKANNEDGRLTEAIAIIERRLKGRLYHVMRENILREQVRPSSDWLVICHGDLWLNNLMFYPDQMRAEQVKLLDFQVLRYTSPVIDVLHFIYSSTDAELRKTSLDQFILDYHTSLMNAVDFIAQEHNVNVQHLKTKFSLEQFKLKLKESALYGLGMAFFILPALTFEPNQIPDLNDVTSDTFAAENPRFGSLLSETYHKRIREIVLEFHDQGLLTANEHK